MGQAGLAVTVRVAALLLALASAPVLAAEAALSIRIEPLAAPVEPLAGLGAANVTVEAPCRDPAAAAPARPVHLRVVEQPAWATITISPATLVPRDCGAREPLGARLLVSTTSAAPARLPATVRIRAEQDDASAEAHVEVTAGYVSIVDAAAGAPTARLPAGSRPAVPIAFTNLGNAPTRIHLNVTETPDGWTAETPPSFLVGSVPTGDDEQSTRSVVLGVPSGSSLGGRVIVAWEAHEEATGERGETGTVAFVAARERTLLDVPSLSLAGGALAAAGAALVRATRR